MGFVDLYFFVIYGVCLCEGWFFDVCDCMDSVLVVVVDVKMVVVMWLYGDVLGCILVFWFGWK